MNDLRKQYGREVPKQQLYVTWLEEKLEHHERFKLYLEIMGGLDMDAAWEATESMEPVRVTIAADEDTPIHVTNITGFKVGDDIVIRDEWYHVTRLEEDSLWVVDQARFQEITDNLRTYKDTGRFLNMEELELLAAADLEPHHWEPGEFVLDTRPSYLVEGNCECLDVHGTSKDCDYPGHAALVPVAVEPWDGLFVGNYYVWEVNPSGGARIRSDYGQTPGWDLTEVGLNQGTLTEAALGYKTEWDGLFLGQYFVSRLNDNGSIEMVEQVPMEFAFPGWSLVAALEGYRE